MLKASFYKGFAVLFGLGFLSAGMMGFMPMFTHDGLLLGIFAVDTLHNVIHLVTGVVALLVAGSVAYARVYFKVFGIIYGLVAVMGFAMHGDMSMLHVPMQMNMADNYLHTVAALLSLAFGFVIKTSSSE